MQSIKKKQQPGSGTGQIHDRMHHVVVNGSDRMWCSSGISLKCKMAVIDWFLWPPPPRLHVMIIIIRWWPAVNEQPVVASLALISALCLPVSGLPDWDTLSSPGEILAQWNPLLLLRVKQADNQIPLCYFGEMMHLICVQIHNQLAAGHHRGILIPSADKSRWRDKLCPHWR